MVNQYIASVAAHTEVTREVEGLALRINQQTRSVFQIVSRIAARTLAICIHAHTIATRRDLIHHAGALRKLISRIAAGACACNIIVSVAKPTYLYAMARGKVVH